MRLFLLPLPPPSLPPPSPSSSLPSVMLTGRPLYNSHEDRSFRILARGGVKEVITRYEMSDQLYCPPLARDLIHRMLDPNPDNRPTLEQLLSDPWTTTSPPVNCSGKCGGGSSCCGQEQEEEYYITPPSETATSTPRRRPSILFSNDDTSYLSSAKCCIMS